MTTISSASSGMTNAIMMKPPPGPPPGPPPTGKGKQDTDGDTDGLPSVSNTASNAKLVNISA